MRVELFFFNNEKTLVLFKVLTVGITYSVLTELTL